MRRITTKLSKSECFIPRTDILKRHFGLKINTDDHHFSESHSEVRNINEYQQAVQFLREKDFKNSLIPLGRLKDILENAKMESSFEYFRVLEK